MWTSANKPSSQGCAAKRHDSPRQLWSASSELAFCAVYRPVETFGTDQTIRDSGDVCGARNTQFEQEFLGLFRAETVSAHDWRDRIRDFCVADYLAEHYTVHVVRYSTRLVSACTVRAHALPTMISTARNGYVPK